MNMRKFFRAALPFLIVGVLVISGTVSFYYFMLWKPFGKPCAAYTGSWDEHCPMFRCRYKIAGVSPLFRGASIVDFGRYCMPTAKNIRRCPVSKVTGRNFLTGYTFDGPWKNSSEPTFYYSDEVDEPWIQQHCPPPNDINVDEYQKNISH